MEHLKKFNENWFRDFLDPDSRDKKPEKKRVKLEDRKRKPEGMDRERYIGDTTATVSNVKKNVPKPKPVDKPNKVKTNRFESVLIPALRECKKIGLISSTKLNDNNWILYFASGRREIKIEMKLVGDDILLRNQVKGYYTRPTTIALKTVEHVVSSILTYLRAI